jgi:hypothetical protein
MNAIDLIKSDHREVDRLFAEILEAEDADTDGREEIFQQLERSLLVHADIEEQVFYPALEEVAPSDIEEAMSEHQEVKQLLAEMLELEVDDEEFDKKLVTLMERVQHHVEEEEASDGILEIAQKHFDERRLTELGTQMQELKRSSEDEIAA